MKLKYLIISIASVIALMAMPFIANATNCPTTFPAAFTNWYAGCTITAGWLNAVETYLGTTTTSTSLQAQINALSGGGGASTTIITAGNQFLLVNQTGVNATLTPISVLSVTSSSDIGVSNATGTNISFSFLNPKGFTTTTIQSVLNVLSATGLATYSTSTGVINVSSSSLNLSQYLTTSTAETTYQPLLGFTPYNATNPAGYLSSTTGLTYFFPATSTVFYPNSNPSGFLTSATGVTTYNGASGAVTGVATNTGNWAGTAQGYTLGSIVTHAAGDYYLSTNPSGFISTSTGLTTANFASPNISQWTNNSGYLSSSTGASYFAPSSTISFTGVTADAPLSGAGTSGSHLIFTNPGYLTSSTGLTYFFPATTTVFYPNSNPNGYTSNAGTVTSITASSPLTGGTFTTSGSIGCQIASGSQAGCLSSTDWTTFNNKQPAGSYLTGNQSITLSGDISGTGTTAITATLPTVNSNVGSYTNANITVNAKGLITAAANGSAGNPGTVTTSTAGTANTLPIWTSDSALGNSAISQSGTSTFINASTTYIGSASTSTPAALIWVTGSTSTAQGYWDATGTVPTLSSCGTSPTIKGNQWRGSVTVGSVAATTCTLTFPVTFVNLPSCIVTSRTATVAVGYSVTTSTLVMTNAALTSDVVDYDCVAQGE